jgi:hypothetical protein
MWLLTRIHHYVVAVIDAAADHAVAFHLEKEDVVGRNEAPVDGDEPITMFRQQSRLTSVNLSIVRHGLGALRAAKPKQIHTARPRRIALDVSLLRKRLKKIGDRLRRFDLELFTDVPNARLICVLGREIEKVVIHRALELC